MKLRKKSYGEYNIIGKNVEKLRKERNIKQKDFIAQMQLLGCDINPTSYSKLEGQLRNATNKEIYVIAKILNVSIETLFSDAEKVLDK
ncbi:MAG: helix-turn-helix transcriptional regulator [Firmicutes bacterium]|nr:helix-turn-helix transcriptional regulator [Bacillota bacterium]